MMASQTLHLTLDNEPGVLARVCGVIHRYNVNIDAIELDTRTSSGTTSLILVVTATHGDIDLITKRLRALVNVADVRCLEDRSRRDSSTDLSG